jgi:uncharacterized protein YcbK (DUF882 family)
MVDDLAVFVKQGPQLVRDFWDCPMTITSGYRTRKYNDWLRENGHATAPNSFHIYDEHPGIFAVDMQMQGVEPPLVYHSILGLIRLKLIPDGGLHLYKNFVHYDNGPRRRW